MKVLIIIQLYSENVLESKIIKISDNVNLTYHIMLCLYQNKIEVFMSYKIR